MLEHDQEVIITDHGRPVAVLKPVEQVKTLAVPVDYYARLKRRMPKSLGKAKSRALHEADRDER
jgi:antitoxin (DNA-binding transcriptional repressor) of toxin-antitoxin stability system